MYIDDLKRDFYNVLTAKRLLILVNYDIDAICTCKILQHLLRFDNIPYTMVPVRGKDELHKSYTENSQEVKCVVLVNCGGTIDIVEFLQPEDDVVFFVMDSHRPTDVCNVYSNGQVRLLGKGDGEDEGVPDFDNIFRDDDDEEDEEQSDGEGSGSDEEGRQDKRRRLAEDKIVKRRERRLWEEERDKLMFEYTQFTYHGHSSAVLMFELAWKLSKDNNDLLWWHIVGVTEQLIFFKVDYSEYVVETGNIQNQVSRLNYGGEGEGDGETTNVKIVFNKELHLALYRHWSVESSLRYSLIPACQLKMWTLRGEEKLHRLLAEMGLPLSQARQKYSAMDMALRQEFPAMMEKASANADNRLESIGYPSFELKYGFRSRICPADYVYAMLALLEHNDPDRSAQQCFLDALDCLSRGNKSVLDDGLERAKLLLVEISKKIQSLMDMKRVISAGPFLYFVLQDDTRYGRPHLLTLLAHFALRAYVAISRNARASRLPLVVSAPLDAATCVVIGVPPISEEQHKNFFGKAFERAAEDSNAHLKTDSFDSCVVQLATADRVRFFDALVSLLS